jgi:hypothetical protein
MYVQLNHLKEHDETTRYFSNAVSICWELVFSKNKRNLHRDIRHIKRPKKEKNSKTAFLFIRE